MGERRRGVAVASLLALMGVAACSSPTSSWTHDGQRVTEAEESIAQLDSIWSQQVAEAEAGLNTEAASCFYQVTNDVVSATAICGPWSVVGDDGTYWMGLPLLPEPAGEGAVVLVAQPEPTSATPLPGAELLRPDGTTGDASLQAPRAIPPAAAVGDTIVLDEGQLADDAAVVDVSQPDQLVRLQVGLLEEGGVGPDTLAAPDGGALVGVRLVDSQRVAMLGGLPQEISDGTESASTIEVVVGEETYPVSFGELGTHGTAFAVGAEDAAVVSTWEQRSTSVDAGTGEISSDTPFEIRSIEAVDDDEQEHEQGDVRFRYTSWDMTAGLASATVAAGSADDGDVWLALDAAISIDTAVPIEGGLFSTTYRDLDLMPTSLVVVADGEEITVAVDDLDVSTDNKHLDLRGTIAVPADVSEISYRLTVDIVGDMQREREGVPRTFELTRVFESTELAVDDVW